MVIDELVPHLIIRKAFVSRPVLGPGSESFIQPQVVPPGHGDQVPKPLMGQFVTNDSTNPLFLTVAGRDWINQEVDITIGLLEKKKERTEEGRNELESKFPMRLPGTNIQHVFFLPPDPSSP